MKIIYLHQYFCTRQGAGATRSYEFARRLVEWGHEVHMVTSERRAPANMSRGWRTEDVDGICVHSLPVLYSNTMGYRQRLRAFGAFAARAGPYAARLPGDVVFATSTPLTIAIPGRYVARRRRIPMVFEVRDLWPEIPIAMGALRSRVTIAAAEWLERFAYGHASYVIALSPGMREGIVNAGYPADRVPVIPNSADLDLFDVPAAEGETFRQEHPWLGERPLVVYAGTMGRANGVGYLARLAGAMRDIAPEVRFAVFGGGAEERAVCDEARRLGVLDETFFMPGKRAKAEMPSVLSAATVVTSLFIDLPQLWTNSANKFFDALAAGRPVAINYRGWQAELIEEHKCGLVLDPQDPESAAKALAEAIDDQAWLKEAGRNARNLAQERFDRDKLAKELEQVLREAVEEGPRGRPCVRVGQSAGSPDVSG